MPPVSPELVEYFVAQPEMFDWKSLYLFHPQPPLEGFEGFVAPLSGPFPGRKFRHVFFHRFGADQRIEGESVLDSSVAGCRDVLIAADGRYCPSVSYPPVELSPPQVAELIAITNQRDKNPKVRSATRQKDLGFVFVDDTGTPVAQIAFGLHGGKVVTLPTNEVLQEGDWGPSRWQRLLRLVDELDPKPSRSQAFIDLLLQQRRRDEQASPAVPLGFFLARHLPAYSSVDSHVREKDFSDEQRAIACAWQQLVWLRGVPHSGGGNGIECGDGWQAIGLDLLECERRFPRCEASIGDVEDCMRHQRFDPCFEDATARQCVALRRCLWGLSLPPDPNQSQ